MKIRVCVIKWASVLSITTVFAGCGEPQTPTKTCASSGHISIQAGNTKVEGLRVEDINWENVNLENAKWGWVLDLNKITDASALDGMIDALDRFAEEMALGSFGEEERKTIADMVSTYKQSGRDKIDCTYDSKNQKMLIGSLSHP